MSVSSSQASSCGNAMHGPSYVNAVGNAAMERLCAELSGIEATGTKPGARPILVLFSDPAPTFETAGSLILCKAMQMRGHPVLAIVPGMPLTFGPHLPDHSSGAACWSTIEGLASRCGIESTQLSRYLLPGDEDIVERALQEDTAPPSAAGLFGKLHEMAAHHASILTHSYSPQDDPAYGARRINCFRSAAYTMLAASRFLSNHPQSTSVVTFNGLFLFNEAVRQAALACGLDAVSWEAAPRSGTLVFTREADAAPHYPFNSLWDKWTATPLSDGQREEIISHLNLRLQGKGLHSLLTHGASALPDRFFTPGRKRLVLFANVAWDSATVGRSGAFSSVGEWMVETVRYFADREDCDIILRPHPFIGITNWRSQSLDALLLGKLGRLPRNLEIMDTSHHTPMASFADLDATFVVYNSSSVYELAYMGKRVVMAADNHYRGKGFTVDAHGRDAYFAALEGPAPAPLSTQERESFLQYSYFILFRVLIPTPMCCVGNNASLQTPDEVNFPEALFPGNSSGMDVICDALALKRDFVMGEPS